MVIVFENGFRETRSIPEQSCVSLHAKCVKEKHESTFYPSSYEYVFTQPLSVLLAGL